MSLDWRLRCGLQLPVSSVQGMVTHQQRGSRLCRLSSFAFNLIGVTCTLSGLGRASLASSLATYAFSILKAAGRSSSTLASERPEVLQLARAMAPRGRTRGRESRVGFAELSTKLTVRCLRSSALDQGVPSAWRGALPPRPLGRLAKTIRSRNLDGVRAALTHDAFQGTMRGPYGSSFALTIRWR